MQTGLSRQELEMLIKQIEDLEQTLNDYFEDYETEFCLPSTRKGLRVIKKQCFLELGDKETALLANLTGSKF